MEREWADYKRSWQPAIALRISYGCTTAFRDRFAVKNRYSDREGFFHAHWYESAAMKTIPAGKCHLFPAGTIAPVPVRYRGLDDRKERANNAVTLSVVVAVIVVLYAAMFLGLYRWSHYASIFKPDDATGPAITQPLE